MNMCDCDKKNIFVKKMFVTPTKLSFTVLLIGCIIACQGKMCKIYPSLAEAICSSAKNSGRKKESSENSFVSFIPYFCLLVFDRDARRSGPRIHFHGFVTLVQNLL